MKLGLLPLAGIVVALVGVAVAVVLIFGADDGDGGGGLEGYVTSVSTVVTDVNTQYTALADEYPQAFQEVEATQTYLEESIGVWSSGAQRLDDLDPPAEAESAHTDLVEATNSVVAAFEEIQTGVEGVTDAAGLEELLNSADTSAFTTFGAACQAVQVLADENQIEVDVGC
jgi:hypothetical protein